MLVLSGESVLSKSIAGGSLKDLFAVVNSFRSSHDSTIATVSSLVLLVVPGVVDLIWGDESGGVAWLLVGGWLVENIDVSPAGVAAITSPVDGSVLGLASCLLWDSVSMDFVWSVWGNVARGLSWALEGGGVWDGSFSIAIITIVVMTVVINIVVMTVAIITIVIFVVSSTGGDNSSNSSKSESLEHVFSKEVKYINLQ